MLHPIIMMMESERCELLFASSHIFVLCPFFNAHLTPVADGMLLAQVLHSTYIEFLNVISKKYTNNKSYIYLSHQSLALN